MKRFALAALLSALSLSACAQSASTPQASKDGTKPASGTQSDEVKDGGGDLGRDAGDARDVDVSPLRAVEEGKVKVDRLIVAAEAGRQTTLNLSHVERGLALRLRPRDRSRQRGGRAGHRCAR